jgi:hypothetical protein
MDQSPRALLRQQRPSPRGPFDEWLQAFKEQMTFFTGLKLDVGLPRWQLADVLPVLPGGRRGDRPGFRAGLRHRARHRRAGLAGGGAGGRRGDHPDACPA